VDRSDDRQLASKHAAMDAVVPVAAPTAAAVIASNAPASKPKAPLKPVKKDMRSLMKGVVIKKKPKASLSADAKGSTVQSPSASDKVAKRSVDDTEADEGAKKQKI